MQGLVSSIYGKVGPVGPGRRDYTVVTVLAKAGQQPHDILTRSAGGS